MQPTTLLVTISALLSTTLALPQRRADGSPGPWYVTGYQPGCGSSPAGCAYGLNISYAPTAGSLEPPFLTTCYGTNIQGVAKPCTDASISSNVVPGFQNDTLFFSHVYTAGGATYNVTGTVISTDSETAGQSFVVAPSSITTV